MLQLSGVLNKLQRVAWHNGQSLCIYGNPVYPLSLYVQTPHRAVNLTQAQQGYNKAMSEVRVAVEWLFGDIKTFFKFIGFKKLHKIGCSAVGKSFQVSALMHSVCACLYGFRIF